MPRPRPAQAPPHLTQAQGSPASGPLAPPGYQAWPRPPPLPDIRYGPAPPPFAPAGYPAWPRPSAAGAMALCEAVARGSSGSWPRVLLFGDSITQVQSLRPVQSADPGWAPHVAQSLGRPRRALRACGRRQEPRAWLLQGLLALLSPPGRLSPDCHEVVAPPPCTPLAPADAAPRLSGPEAGSDFPWRRLQRPLVNPGGGSLLIVGSFRERACSGGRRGISALDTCVI